VADDLERPLQREVPPQLGPLAEHHPDAAGQPAPLAPGHEAVDRHVAGRRHQQAAHHLDGGGLAGAVGAGVADERALLDPEVHAVHAGHPTVPGAELLAQPLDLDDRPGRPARRPGR
jgi:hypothetical protein